MTDHPLIPHDIRAYIEKHQIESGLNKALNVVLQSLPQDPFSSMAVTLIDMNPSLPIIAKIHAKPTFIQKLSQESMQIDVYLNYQGVNRCYFSYIFTFNESERQSITWDKEAEQNGMRNACQIINQQLSPQLVDKDLSSFKKIDQILLNFKQRLNEQNQTAGPNIIQAVSQAIFFASAKAQEFQYPFLSIYRTNMLREFQPPLLDLKAQTPNALQAVQSFPKLIFNVLNGGKEALSKVKFSRFYLIIDVSPSDVLPKQFQEGQEPQPALNVHEMIIKFNSNIERIVGSTKQGLAAFKRSNEGAFFNAYDNINESFKAIEDAIAAVGVNTDQRKYLKIGINTDAQSYFIQDISKYEWDGPKVQYDEDQLVDFYEKIINEHPLVDYIEDPFAVDKVISYRKLQDKLKISNPNVKIGIGHSMLKSDLDIIKEYTLIIQPEPKEEVEDRSPSRQSQDESGAENENSKTLIEEKKEDKNNNKKVAPAVIQKDTKAPAKGKDQKTIVEVTTIEAQEDNKKPDINANKFIPNIIRLSRDHCNMVSQFQQILNYSMTLKPEQSFGLIIEDPQIDSLETDIIDFAFGAASISQMGKAAGGVRFISLCGFGRLEKSVKIQRYFEILKYIASLLKNE